jgi:hypothetical protein
MRLRGLSSWASASGRVSVVMMNDPMGMSFLLQRGSGFPGVAAGGDEDFARPQRAARGRDLPSRLALTRFALQAFDPRVLEDFCTGFHGGAAESGDVARGIQSRADFIDHAAVVNVRSDLCAQLVSALRAVGD